MNIVKLCVGPDGDFWSESGPTNPVGQYVAFQIPAVNGKRRVVGKVTRALDTMRLEVRSQEGGYYQIWPNETIT